MYKMIRILRKILLWFFILSIGSVILYAFIPVPVSPLMLIRLKEQWSADKGFRMQRDWVSLSEVNPAVVQAVICAEDANFLRHHGFDLKAINAAYKANKQGKKIKGASTISQQTAKNVFLWPSRTYLRKGLEAYFTVLIELFWSKKRIMEVYLNVIETGDGIYGIEAASQEYYKKKASALNRGEAAMIASILPNPRIFSPLKPSSKIYRKQKNVLRRMRSTPPPDWK